MSNKIFFEFSEELESTASVLNIILDIDSIQASLLFHKGLSDIKRFNEYYLPYINQENIQQLNKKFPGVFAIAKQESKPVFTKDIFSGVILLYIEQFDLLYNIELRNIPRRSIENNYYDPKTTFGSQDAFIEDVNINVALLQNRVKDQSFKIDDFEIGTRSKTTVKLCYLKSVANDVIISQITQKLNETNIDLVSSVHDISNLFSGNSFFPLVANSASPEIVEDSIVNGRAVILIDTIPVCIILPVTLEFVISTKEEAESPIYHSIYTRVLIFTLMFLSIFLLGFYLSVVAFHTRNLSLVLISEIKVTTRGANLPLLGEIIFILIVFEFLRLASSRTAISGVQSFVIVVGGLLIGQNTVQSGFVGAFTVVLTALSYLSAYAISNHQHFITSIFYFRIFVLIGGFIAGLFGVLITGIISMAFLYSQNSVGVPFLAPLTPFFNKEFIKLFVPKNTKKYATRPESIKPKDSKRGS